MQFKSYNSGLLFYSGARAFVKLNLFDEAITWCNDGLAVSFDDLDEINIKI